MADGFDPRSALREAERMLKALVNQLDLPARILDFDRRVLHETTNRPPRRFDSSRPGGCGHPCGDMPGRGCPYCEIERQLRAGVAREMIAKFAGMNCRLRFEPVAGADGTVSRVDAFLLPWS